MDPTTAAAGAGGAAGAAAPTGGSAAGGGDASGGNAQLQASFNQAIQAANETLEITTKNGAILYSLKQSVR